MLLPGKRFVTADSFRDCLRDHAVCVEDGNPRYTCSTNLLWASWGAVTLLVEEGGMRVWLHCKYSEGTHKLLFSPDTDTYHVRIGLLEDIRPCECDVYVYADQQDL